MSGYLSGLVFGYLVPNSVWLLPYSSRFMSLFPSQQGLEFTTVPNSQCLLQYQIIQSG